MGEVDNPELDATAEKLLAILEQHLDSLPVMEKRRIMERLINKAKRENN